MSPQIRLVPLDLVFSVRSAIDKLPFCHCVAWNGYLRSRFRELLPEYVTGTQANASLDMRRAGMRSVPAENGVRSYEEGQKIAVGLTFDPRRVDHDRMERILDTLREAPRAKPEDADRLHFSERTVGLADARCRICGHVWTAGHRCELDDGALQSGAASLRGRALKVVFFTPLMLKRRSGLPSAVSAGVEIFDEGRGRSGLAHPFVDPVYVRSPEGRAGNWGGFAATVWGAPGDQAERGARSLPEIIGDPGVLWLKTEYRRPSSPLYMSFNGLVGSLSLSSSEDEEFLFRLEAGRLVGVGNGTAMGFGAYEVVDAESGEPLAEVPSSARRSSGVLSSGIDLAVLRDLAKELPDLPNRPDSERASDIVCAPESWYENFLADLRSGSAAPRKLYSYPLRRGDKERLLYMTNARDHLLQKCVSLGLQLSLDPPFHPLFKECAFAYRRGRGYHAAVQVAAQALNAGQTTGHGLDIASFFESVPRPPLLDLLRGLLWGDPALTLLADWFAFLDAKKVKGLPQGSPLSPPLSNLYLLPLDEEMSRACRKGSEEAGIYVRYSDDILILHRRQEEADAMAELCGKLCSELDLKLRPEKSFAVKGSEAFVFLGHRLAAGVEPLRVSKEEDDWHSLSCRSFARGIVLYLSGAAKRIVADRDHLTVEFKEGATVVLPAPYRRYAWKEISRIVALAGTPSSSLLVEQALRRQIPLAFIDHRGALSGMFLPEHLLDSTLPAKQTARFESPAFRLSAARSLIAAKLRSEIANLESWRDQEKGAAETRRKSVAELKARLADLSAAEKEETILGLEGAAARSYFGCFPALCRPFAFEGRTYRPPKGEVNAALSFGYTLLYSRTAAAVKAQGLLPHVGIMHLPHGSHMVLVSDLMEPLRFIVDRAVIGLIKNGRMRKEAFIPRGEDGSLSLMSWEFRNEFIAAFEAAFSETGYDFRGFDRREGSWALEENIRRLLAAIRLGTDFESLELA